MHSRLRGRRLLASAFVLGLGSIPARCRSNAGQPVWRPTAAFLSTRELFTSALPKALPALPGFASLLSFTALDSTGQHWNILRFLAELRALLAWRHAAARLYIATVSCTCSTDGVAAALTVHVLLSRVTACLLLVSRVVSRGRHFRLGRFGQPLQHGAFGRQAGGGGGSKLQQHWHSSTSNRCHHYPQPGALRSKTAKIIPLIFPEGAPNAFACNCVGYTYTGRRSQQLSAYCLLQRQHIIAHRSLPVSAAAGPLPHLGRAWIRS